MKPRGGIATTLAVVLLAAQPQLAEATGPDVKPGEKGVTISGEDIARDSRLGISGPPPSKGGKKDGKKGGKGTRGGSKAEQAADRFPGIEAEPGSCVLVGGGSEAALVARGCVEPPPVTPARPTQPGQPVRPQVEQITTEVVRSELKNVDFPALAVQIQPRTRTLVNLKTIVYTKPIPVDQIVPILTWPVGVRASVDRYTWTFGDGTIETTTSPGKPYPALDVVHQYKKRGNVAVTVTAHYIARYQVPGGPWRTLPGTVDIAGPPTALTVAEARPVLVDPGR